MNTKALESLVVVAVHVAHQKVKDGKVDQVQQTATLVDGKRSEIHYYTDADDNGNQRNSYDWLKSC